MRSRFLSFGAWYSNLSEVPYIWVNFSIFQFMFSVLRFYLYISTGLLPCISACICFCILIRVISPSVQADYVLYFSSYFPILPLLFHLFQLIFPRYFGLPHAPNILNSFSLYLSSCSLIFQLMVSTAQLAPLP